MSTKKPKSALLSLQDRVANIYYTHGLFCSMHPVPVICFALTIIILCCYPFVNFSLPGNVPQEYVTPASQFSLPSSSSSDGLDGVPSLDNRSVKPLWFSGPPAGYVQQIVVRSVVFPWRDDLVFMDWFRGPLSKVFDIVEIVQNYQLTDDNSSVLLDDLCIHVAESKAKKTKDLLPMYGCLLVSPANVWKKNSQQFLEDADIIRTILSLGTFDQSSAALADVLFGVPWKETAIKKSYVVNRPRVVTYAVTMLLKQYDAEFVRGLESRLHQSYPFLHVAESVALGNVTHVYFHGHYSFIEFIPLTVTYVILFLYIYFSVSKIEMVKSKIGMAFSAVVTVLASLCMSVGLCTWFGLSFTIRAGEIYLKDIFPYLVVIVGLENILVLTKSVVSTPVNLDVKVRLAQGLSKEGWSITKNLVTELAILTFGFFTFVPAIQEFCLFAVVGLLSDFFLQLVFFATVLAVDIGRMEMSDLQRQSRYQSSQPSEDELTHTYPLFSWPQVSRWHRGEAKASSLQPSDVPPRYPANVVAPSYPAPSKAPLVKVPKRLRVAYFWARCRIFQRAFMVAFFVWVVLIIYKSGIVSVLTVEQSTPAPEMNYSEFVSDVPRQPRVASHLVVPPVRLENFSAATGIVNGSVNLTAALRHPRTETWRDLRSNHWPILFGYFNLTLTGRYVSILPSIKLSVPVSPEEATAVRHPLEHRSPRLSSWPEGAGDSATEWKGDEEPSRQQEQQRGGFYPSTPAELVLTAVLAIPSVIFLVYVMMVLYQCICTRNYAEWRSSWSGDGSKRQSDIFTQLIIEAMPVVLDGHSQEVECLATDGNVVVSTCLAGEICVWDSMSGECLTVINRNQLAACQQQQQSRCHKDDDQPSDYESGSPPSRSDSFLGSVPQRIHGPDDWHLPDKFRKRDAFKHLPNLSSSISTDFASSEVPPTRTSGAADAFDFSRFHVYYDEHRQLMQEEEEEEEVGGGDSVQQKQKLPLVGSGDMSPTATTHSPRQDVEHPVMTEGDCSSLPAVWCVDCKDGVIVAGCSDGKIEFWDTLTGVLRYCHEEASHQGVTAIRIYCNRIVAVRLNGSVDFLEFVFVQQNVEDTSRSAFRMHRRTNCQLDVVAGTLSSEDEASPTWDEDEFVCRWLNSARAHQQPVTVLEVEGGKAVTGSQDHTLKVFRVEDTACLWTLHGHYGPVTTLFIDKLSPMTAASGSQDGAVCLWDLQTGTCVCRLHGHDGAITALSYTASYVLSAGTDNRLLVWERFHGHLLNTISLVHNYCNSIIMLTDNLLLTGRQGSLGIWDIRLGDPAVRIVRLGNSDDGLLVRHVRNVGHTIVCDYGCQLRVVRFPAIVGKVD